MQRKTFQWYAFYSNEAESKCNVLTKSEYILHCNIIIARRISSKLFQFAKLNDIDEFIHLHNNTPIANRTYYAVLTKSLRYLYLDIDYKLSTPLNNRQKCLLIGKIKNVLNTFNNCYYMKFGFENVKNKWLIWDATRCNKFSLHIINTNIILKNKTQYIYCNQLNAWIRNNNIFKNFAIKCDVFDNNIYHDNYQLWRLPDNHNCDRNSILKLHINQISLWDQFNINFMCNISECNMSERNMSEYKLNKYFSNNNMHNTKLQNSMFINHKYKSNVFNMHSTEIDKKVLNDPKKVATISGLSTLQQQQICDIFGNEYTLTHMKNKNFPNIQYRIKSHFCPIANRKHLRNTGTLIFCNFNVPNNDFKYIKYYCTDQNCHRIGKYYSLSNILLRPWIFDNMIHLPLEVIQETDICIDALFVKNILKFRKNSPKYYIFKNNKLKFYEHNNKDNLIWSSFFENHIVHSVCNESNITLCYRSKDHKWVRDWGAFCCYCKKCGKFIYKKRNKFNDNQNIKHTNDMETI